MFHHLFNGAPPWLLMALEVGLTIHIGSGAVAILSGAGALATRKGGVFHRRLGTVFFCAMLAMSMAASALAAVAVQRGFIGQVANVFGGIFAFYLVSTGWLTVRRPAGTVGRVDFVGFASVLVVAAVAAFWLLPSTLGPDGEARGVPVAAPIILTAMATLLAALDLKVILRRGVAGVSRITRHVWRMCLGLFIASGSFFIGQQADMPASVQGSPILLLLGFAPVLAMVFWLGKTWWSARRTAIAASRPVAA